MSSLSRTLSHFLARRYFYLIYPAILISGLSIRAFLLDEETVAYAQQNWNLVSSKNQINQIFAYKGNKLFLVLFCTLFICRCVVLLREGEEHHPTSTALQSLQSNKLSLLHMAKSFSVRYLIKVYFLDYIFTAIDEIFFDSGGRCVIGNALANNLANHSKSYEECLGYNGTWVRVNTGFCLLTPKQFAEGVRSADVCRLYGKWSGGFDVSGHMCFLMTLSLLIFNELRLLDKFRSNGASISNEKADEVAVVDDWISLTFVNFFKWLNLVVLSIWAYLLLITAIFYHTNNEKLTGFLFGMICPLILYVLIPNTPILNRVLYKDI